MLKQAIPVTSEQGQGRGQLFQETAFTPLRNKCSNPRWYDGLRKKTITQPVCAFSQGRKVIHEDLFRHFCLSQLDHCVRRAEHRSTLTDTPWVKKGRVFKSPMSHPPSFYLGRWKGALFDTKIHTSEDEMFLTYYPLMDENKTDCR